MTLQEKLLSGEATYLQKRESMERWYQEEFTPACIKALEEGFERVPCK